MRFIPIVAVLLLAIPASAAQAPPAAAPPTPPSCDSAEHHQMDFWLGEWNLTWQGGKGTNRITRGFNDCVIIETFAATEGTPPLLHGTSLSSYQPMNKMWRQTWADDQNGYFHLSGGKQDNGTFILQTVRMGREPSMTRMVFEDIKADSFTWRWQKSDEGDTWTDTWVVHYARVK